MGKREPIIIAHMTFKTKVAATSYIQELIKHYSDGDIVTIADFYFVQELLENHPNPEKARTEVANFRIKSHSRHPNTKAFYIIDHQGKEIDFSWHKCIKGDASQ